MKRKPSATPTKNPASRDVAERKQTKGMLRHRDKVLSALNAIATTMGQPLGLDHILNATLDTVLEVMEMDGGWIRLLDAKEEGSLSLVAHRGLSQEECGDVGVWRLYAVTDVPIKSRGRALGMLGVFSRSPREVSAQDVQLLSTIGRQIAMTVENRQLAKKPARAGILEGLSRPRSELIANVSHELRTSLGLIEVCCSSLLEEDVEFDRETRRQFLHAIDEETDRLAVIVDSLLNLSREETGQLYLDRRPTDMSQLARKVVARLALQFPQRRFAHDFPPDLPLVSIDAGRIEQVLHNLLTNAVKYSPESGTITVQGREDKRQVVISVTDQGVGIPPEELERIFQRFYRVENKVNRRVGGNGLGLALCRSLIEAHGGSIWAESVLGRGSRFSLTLSAKRDA